MKCPNCGHDLEAVATPASTDLIVPGQRVRVRSLGLAGTVEAVSPSDAIVRLDHKPRGWRGNSAALAVYLHDLEVIT